MKSKVFSILFFIAFSLTAQDFNKSMMDSLFSLIDENQKGMGSISIFENGQEVYQNSFGYASLENRIKANKKTKYRIGSISKTFTATIIMKLIEEGKLSLDTKLNKYFPEIKNSDKITIHYLLRHRSGIYNFTNASDYKQWMEKPITKSELINKIAGFGSVFIPGEKEEYSNSNYVLLSFIAESVEGKNFSAILQARITKPMELEDTYYGSKIKIKNNEAKSYIKLNTWKPATETDMSVPLGAGGIVSTPTDLNIFLNGLFNGEIVSDSTVITMKTTENNIGIGMFKVPFHDKNAFGHMGGIDGFQSNALYFPEDKVSIAYLSNGVSMPVNDILIGALSIYFNMQYDFPEFIEPIQLSSEELDTYLGIYSDPAFPLKITISKKDNVLIGQATGQPSFPLEAFDTHKFRFDQAKLKIEFIPEESKLMLYQGGREFVLTRED